MASEIPAAADLERSSERFVSWLAEEVARRRQSPASGLLVLWDVLEEWFGSAEFATSEVAAAVAAPPDGRGPAAHAALAEHRRAMRRLLRELAGAAGAPDPDALAGQLLLLVEGAIVGAVVDHRPEVARHGRALTQLALELAGG